MRVETPEARAYYLTTSADQNWSTRVLERQFNTNTFQRLLSTQQAPAEAAQADKLDALRQE